MFSYAWCFGHTEPHNGTFHFVLTMTWAEFESHTRTVNWLFKFTFASFVIRFLPPLGTFFKAFTGDRILNISAYIAVCGQRCAARGSSTS